MFWGVFFSSPCYYSDPAASKGDSGSKKKAKRAGGRKKAIAPRCVKCDAVMKGGMKFCNKCGSSQVDEKIEDAKKPVGVERAKGVSEEDDGEEEIVVIVEEEEVIVEKKDFPAVPEPVFKKPEVPLNRRTPASVASHSQTTMATKRKKTLTELLLLPTPETPEQRGSCSKTWRPSWRTLPNERLRLSRARKKTLRRQSKSRTAKEQHSLPSQRLGLFSSF